MGTDYEISYSDNIDVGTALMTVTGTGSYKGSVDTTFRISDAGGNKGGGDSGGGDTGCAVRQCGHGFHHQEEKNLIILINVS